MTIRCHKCHKYLGEIKEGSKLRKGMITLCSECGTILMHEAKGCGMDFMEMLMNASGKGRK